MLLSALIIFAIGALGGLTLAAVYVLQGKLAPWGLSLLHGALGAIGLLVLLYAALTSGISSAASRQRCATRSSISARSKPRATALSFTLARSCSPTALS